MSTDLETVSAPALPGELLMAPLTDLHESAKNPRQYFAPGPLGELAESIKASGVRVPLIVRPRLEGGGYEIGAGHRRYRAAKLAGVSHVPVLVRDMSDAEFQRVLSFDNLQREDVHPLEEAAGYRAYMDETLADVETVAAETGKSTRAIYQLLQMEKRLTPESKRAFWDGKISKGHAALIAPLDAKDQKLAVRACEPPAHDPSRTVSVRELAAWIKRNLQIDLTQAPFSRTDPTLVAEAGACGPCEYRLGNAPDFDPGEDLGEMCTRKECYEQKLHAFVNIEMGRILHAEKSDVVLVSEIAGAHVAGILRPRDWSEVFNSFNPASKEAFVVEGPRMGKRIRVLVQERIAPPEPSASAPPKKQSKAPAQPARSQAEIDAEVEEAREQEAQAQRDREERDRQREAEKKTRLAIAQALLDRVKWPPRREDVLGMVEESSLAEVPEPLEEIMLHEFGVRAFPHFDLLSDAQAARLVVLLAIMNDFDEWSFNHGCDTLHAVAKRYGVDVAKIREKAKEAEGGTRKEVVAKLPALAGAKPAAKKAAPKKAAPAKKSPAKKAAKPAAKKGGKKGK